VARLTDRFYRHRETDSDEAVAGTGLGLAIVLRICELHGFGFSVEYRAQEERFYAVVDFRSRAAQTDRRKAEQGDHADTAG